MFNPMDFSGGKGLSDNGAGEVVAEMQETDPRLAQSIEDATNFGVAVKDMIIDRGLNPAAATAGLVSNLVLLIAYATSTAGKSVGQALVDRITTVIQGAVDQNG